MKVKYQKCGEVQMWFQYTKRFENSIIKLSTSFADMRYMQNNGGKFQNVAWWLSYHKINGLLMHHMDLDKKIQQMQVSWSFMKW